MAKLTDLKRKKIIADYLENQNYTLTAKMHNVSMECVRRIVLRDKESSQRLLEKREENTESVLEHMKKQSAMKNRILDKLLRGIEIKADDVDELSSIKELATAYGIIVDKELKILELQRGNGTVEELDKVKELLTKIEEEAEK